MSMTKEEAVEVVAQIKATLTKLDNVENLLRMPYPPFNEQIMASCNDIESFFNNKEYEKAEELLIATSSRLQRYEGDEFDDFMVLAWLQVLNIQLMYAQRDKYTLEQVLESCAAFKAFSELDHAHKIKHLEITVLFIKAEVYALNGRKEDALDLYEYILNIGVRAECIEWIIAGFSRYIELVIPEIKKIMLTGRGGKKDFKTAIQRILNYRKLIKHIDEFNIYFEYLRYLNGSSVSGLFVECRKNPENIQLLEQLLATESVQRDCELRKQLKTL